MKKRAKRKHGRRAHRRNPSSHPILAAIATIIVEGLAQWSLVALAGGQAGKPGWVGKQGAVALLTTGGGYALGTHFFPQSKMPILVGSVLHALFTGIAIPAQAGSLRGALNADAAPQVTG
jgi:hypothetical protein